MVRVRLVAAALPMVLFGTVLIGTGPTLAAATTPGTVVLSKAVVPGITHLRPIGVPSAAATLTVGLTIDGRDPRGLADRIAAEYNPASPLYHQFLTPDEFAASYGAAPDTASAVISWLQQGGLAITGINRAHTSFVAEGTVAQVASRFAAPLAMFRSGTTTFMANTVAPTVPVGVTSVTGLEDLDRPRTSAFPVAASGGYGPEDLASVYDMPPSSTNAGQGQALTAFGWGTPGTLLPDLRSFEAIHTLPQIPLKVVQVGAPGTDTSGQAEWDLDAQASSGIANSVQGLTFYFVNSGLETLITQAVQAWADDPTGSLQASGSYGLCEIFAVTGEFDAHDKALAQAVSEGRTFFAATGDNGSGCSALVDTNGITIGPVPSQEYPATSAYAVAVGGTLLYTNGSGASATRDREIAWTHGGGGPSYFTQSPSWQQPTMTSLYGQNACLGDDRGFIYVGPGPACRGVADVAALAGGTPVAGTPAGDGGYGIIVGGTPTVASGTSLAAPLWQGMWARINAAAPATAGVFKGLGYANPLLYGVGTTAAEYANDFFDVQVGSNGAYPALPGWDFPTGWGVADVTHLMQELAHATAAANPIPPPPVSGGPALTPCPPAPQITGDTGDATQLLLVDTGLSVLDAPALDITDAGVSWDSTQQALVFSIDVQDLSQDPPLLGNGEYYRWDFTYNRVGYEIFASRTHNQPRLSVPPSLTSGTAFGWTIPGVGSSSISPLAGSFGVPGFPNRIQITLPATTFSQFQPGQPALATGGVLSALGVLAQRNLLVFTLTADSETTTSPCSYTL